MKIKFLFLAAVLGFVQLASAQTKTFSVKEYEPAPNTVQVKFKNGYTTSEQVTAEGHRMVVAYEQGLNFNLSLVTIYPLGKNEKMDVDMEARFAKLIADQLNAYQLSVGGGTPQVPNKQMLTGTPGFTSDFVIGDYTYSYRVVAYNNVYYMASVSYLTAERANVGVGEFLGSFNLAKQ